MSGPGVWCPWSLKHGSMEEAAKHGWGLLLVTEKTLYARLKELMEERKHVDILEVGCFKGLLHGWLMSKFPRPPYSWRYAGVDIVAPPDRRKDYCHFVMNAEALEFPPQSFDAVIMIEVLEHVIDYVKALREAYRVLRPRGLLYIQSVMCSDPNAIADETHFHVLHPVTLSRLLRWLGFTDVGYEAGANMAVWARKP